MNLQFANELYPQGCSCGIDYEAKKITYNDHLKLDHIVKE